MFPQSCVDPPFEQKLVIICPFLSIPARPTIGLGLFTRVFKRKIPHGTYEDIITKSIILQQPIFDPEAFLG